MGAGALGEVVIQKTLQGTAKIISGNSFVLTVRKTDYSVTVADSTRVVDRVWHKINLSDIRNGDKVRVFGKIDGTAISAQIVRDISLPAHAAAVPNIHATSTATTTVHAPRIRYKDGTSTNWSGYAAETNLTSPQNNAVSDVKGSWVVPQVTCGSTNTYSAAWLGIDGYSDNTVEQIGTEQDCANGTPSYYAWYEMYPKPSFKVNLPVKAGDTIAAEVKYVGGNKFQLTLTDATTGKNFTTTQNTSNAHRQSAEWIMEAPWSGSVLPLANFGTVGFSNSQATINSHIGTISDSSWKNDQITMVNSAGSPKATPSSLSPDGSSFTISWNGSN